MYYLTKDLKEIRKQTTWLTGIRVPGRGEVSTEALRKRVSGSVAETARS